MDKFTKADEKVRAKLPPGVKLVRTLRGYTNSIGRIAWSPDGRMLAAPSGTMIELWNTETGATLRMLEGHKSIVVSAAFDPTGRTLASGSYDDRIKVWESASGKLIR